MMEHVKDDFYVEDEPVLVIPSRMRRQARTAARMALALLDDLRRIRPTLFE
jgi:hypothetical protein